MSNESTFNVDGPGTRGEAASSALRDSEIRYRRLFEAAQDGILLVNAGSGQIEDANPFLTAMLGYSHAALLGKKLWDVGAFVDVAKCTEMFERLQIEGYVRYDDLPLKTSAGALISVEFVSNVYDSAGVRVIQCNIRDISQNKRDRLELDRHRHALEELVEARTQELAVAKNAAEAANIAKSTFLSNMSHEIRTPLGAITGLTYLMQRSPLTSQQAGWLSMLEVSAAHLLELINAVLDMSRIEAGKLALVSTPVNAGQIAASVVSILSQLASAKRLNLLVERHPLPNGLVGDAARLQQALLNYAGNAVKFTRSGSVTLRTRCVEETADSALIRFEVQDTGPGIAPKDLERLFLPFEQLDISTTRQHGGTGLGLAIVRQLAQLMGGEAGAQSVEDVGSTFWFTARLGKRDHADALLPPLAGSAQATLLRGHAQARVLVVDDEPLNREVALALLRTVFIQVDVAASGLDAVRMAGETVYDLILMDLRMPDIDGLAATRQIRMLPGNANPLIVALTANAFAEDRAACFAAGMDDFLAKPVRVEDLFETALRGLLRRRQSSPRV